MKLLLGFLPFAVFALFDRLASTQIALALAGGAALLLAARDVRAGKTPKLMEAGAAVLFGGLAIYTGLSHATWTVTGVRLCTDAGMFLLVMGSVLVGQPFTLAYAKEQTPPSVWGHPAFLSTNRRISAAWGAAFGVMVLADVGMLRGLPVAAGVVVTVAALAGAVVYTGRITQRAGRTA